MNTADIVFEELVEGGTTRFAAMFHSTVPPTVAPVRSLRDVDRAIAGPTGGLARGESAPAGAGRERLGQVTGAAAGPASQHISALT